MAEIYAGIIVHGKRANISLKTKIAIQHWDKNGGRVMAQSPVKGKRQFQKATAKSTYCIYAFLALLKLFRAQGK
ncbi:hypothetical protein HC174_02880 [Salinimicrobium sp. CDJ15-81-2]|nr:hypothetical protein [Salinimicrobium nanhaiense]